MKYPLILACIALGISAPAAAQTTLTSADFEATPTYVDTFSGGTPAFEWELDPGNLSGVSVPQFITATPGTISPSFVAADPMAGATDGGAMMMGNDSGTAGTLFGLNYVIATNSQAGGGGTPFEELESFKVVARIWSAAQSDLGAPDQRYQPGPYAYGDATSTLFRPSIGHNAGSGGVAVGTNVRGFTSNPSPATGLPPGSLAEGRWTLMSMLVQKREGEDVADVSVGIDANNDGIIDENDTDEFYTDLTINTNDFPVTTFGIFTVGAVSNDVQPAFVDFVEFYEPAQTSARDWQLYH